MNKYIKVRNFELYQHYKDRNPPWIKLYTRLLDDVDFLSTDDDLKWPIVGLFLLASRLENKIPLNASYLRSRLGIRKLDIKRLVQTPFIVVVQDASKPLAECLQVATDANFPLVPSDSPNPLTETEKQSRERESALAVPELRRPYGEFGNVLLTDSEYSKLKDKLNGHSQYYIDQLDRWAVDSPAKFGKRKNHYATLLTWHDRDVKEGKVREFKSTENPNTAAARDFVSRKLAESLQPDLPDVRENPRRIAGPHGGVS